MTDTPTTQDQTVLITRIFDAPRELVFRAWTDPDHLARWFGPEGMDTPRESVAVDLRVGGSIALTMVGRDSGMRMPLVYEIAELDAPRLLVLTSGPMPEMGMPEQVVTRIEFHDHGEKTRMTLSDGPHVRSTPAETGWHAAFDALEALLA